MLIPDETNLELIRALDGEEFETPRGPIEALFYEGFAVAQLATDVEATDPYLQARSSDVRRLQLAKGVMLVRACDGRVFRVVRLEPDGTGMHRLVVTG